MEPIQLELRDLVSSFLKKNPDGARKLAHELGVSIPTIEKRWAKGKNLPHPAIARVAIKHMKAMRA